MKIHKEVQRFLPVVAVAMAAYIGFATSAPVLQDVVWPEAPVIETVQAASLREKKTRETETEPMENVLGNYEDGTYYGSGAGYSGITSLEVLVENHQISQVNIKSYGDDESFFQKAKKVIETVIRKQTWEVDSVSGATYSSRGILEAIRNALTGTQEISETKAAVQKSKAPVKNSDFDDSVSWKDGSYTGSASGFGGTITVKVTIKKGKIVKVQVTGHSGETASYYKKASAMVSRIVAANSPNVDTVSGATYTSGGIREAVKAALKKAAGEKIEETSAEKETKKKKKKKEEESLPDGSPKDGIYTAQAYTERWDYDVRFLVEYKGGSLVSLSDFEMVNNTSEANEKFARKAWEGMSKKIMEDISGQVDVVSGATYTSDAIRRAYVDVYCQAIIDHGGELPTSSESSEESSEEITTDEENQETSQESEEETSGESEGETASEESGETEESSGEEESSSEEMYVLKDGSYTVSAVCEPDEWEDFGSYTLTSTFTFSKDRLTDITLVSPAASTTNGEYCMRAIKGILGQNLRADSSKVDSVSGATCSSDALIACFRKAVKAAKE